MLDLILEVDEVAVRWLCLRRSSGVTFLMRAATRIGDGYVWMAVSIAILLFAEEGWRTFQQLAVAFGLDLSVYKIMKRLFSRPRPFVLLPFISQLHAPPDEYSFPSGHTAAAFVMVTVVGSTYGVLVPPLLVLAMLIGFSRVYLGVHFPSDVIAGTVLGVLSGAAGMAMV
jgi:undecaprenyl-diphosphatase